MASLLVILPIVVIGLVVLVGIGLLAVGIVNQNQIDPLAERLRDYSGKQELTANLEDIEMSVPFTQRVVLPILQTIARFTTQFAPQNALEKTQRQLNLAGNPNGLTPPLMWAMRFGAMFSLAILMLILLGRRGPTWAVMGTLGGGAIGFMMPAMWLTSKIQRRQNEILKALPDALDLMSICVEAGLGFDQAMAKVYEKWQNELAIAFGRVIREIQVGKTRRDALRGMAENMDVPDVTSFVAAIIQADQLGVSISRVLKIQAEQMRIKRRQRAQEKAQQAPIKMMIPMALLIFPTIYLVILGPAAIQLYKAFWEP
jgi:tight adherence protein C